MACQDILGIIIGTGVGTAAGLIIGTIAYRIYRRFTP